MTQSTGLYRFDRRTEKFEAFQHIEKDDKTIVSDQVFTVFEDNKKRIWVGTKSGVDLFDNGIFKHFKTPLSNLGVTSIIQARNNTFLCSTTYGVYNFFETADGSLLAKNYDMEQPGTPVTTISYSANFCYTLLEDPNKDNFFWVATKQGLVKLDATKNQRATIEASTTGMSNSTIYAMLFPVVTNGNHLWLGTEDGLNRYNTSTGVFERFFADP